jgi:hypothetical protein
LSIAFSKKVEIFFVPIFAVIFGLMSNEKGESESPLEKRKKRIYQLK